jgi:hypothetical protein
VLGARGAVLMRSLLTVVMCMVSRMLIVQKLRGESVGTDLVREVRRGHEAGGDQRACNDSHQQKADDPLALNAAEDSVWHACET